MTDYTEYALIEDPLERAKALTQITKRLTREIREVSQMRDAAFVEVYETGMPLRQIQEIIDLDNSRIHRILVRAGYRPRHGHQMENVARARRKREIMAELKAQYGPTQSPTPQQ